MSAPEILFEQQGLRIKRNGINGFIVVTLHHTADHLKRDPNWRKVARQGMTPEKFAREYDIDYQAVLGARAFPELTTLRSHIISEPMDFGGGVKYWAGLDYGVRNPSSFHVYTIIDGVTYSVWELYKPCKNIPQFVEEMKKFPYWGSIRYIATDPNLWTATQQQSNGQPISIQDLFYQAGLRNMIRGIQDEEAWLATMRKHWASEDVTFKISEACPHQINEFETAIYSDQSERQLLTQSYRETLADVNNHSLDDCKYFMNSRPKQESVITWKDPGQVARWSVGGVGKPSSDVDRRPVKGYI